MTPSARLAAALNQYDEETAEMAHRERAENDGYTLPSGSEARDWFNGAAVDHPDYDDDATEAMDLDDGTLAATDGLTVTPHGGRWVVGGPVTDYLCEEE